ncbi:DUF192 domain-containing protein [Halomonas halophila]|uniref:DUF192 domain-containing protein n=1 Tax=Halomonas halophila TaxID=29573 RepID=UPI003644EDCF
MYRTLIPLDIAFIDEAGRIVDIRRMAPCTSASARDCPVTRPDAPYQAALEVNAGVFEAHGIAVGDCVSWPVMAVNVSSTSPGLVLRLRRAAESPASFCCPA